MKLKVESEPNYIYFNVKLGPKRIISLSSNGKSNYFEWYSGVEIVSDLVIIIYGRGY